MVSGHDIKAVQPVSEYYSVLFDDTLTMELIEWNEVLSLNSFNKALITKALQQIQKEAWTKEELNKM